MGSSLPKVEQSAVQVPLFLHLSLFPPSCEATDHQFLHNLGAILTTMGANKSPLPLQLTLTSHPFRVVFCSSSLTVTGCERVWCSPRSR